MKKRKKTNIKIEQFNIIIIRRKTTGTKKEIK